MKVSKEKERSVMRILQIKFHDFYIILYSFLYIIGHSLEQFLVLCSFLLHFIKQLSHKLLLSSNYIIR